MLLRYNTKRCSTNIHKKSYSKFAPLTDFSHIMQSGTEQFKEMTNASVDEVIDISINRMAVCMKRTEMIFVKQGIKDVNISISINVGIGTITANKYINKE